MINTAESIHTANQRLRATYWDDTATHQAIWSSYHPSCFDKGVKDAHYTGILS